MNPLNYGSREACERLHKAGVVVETDFVYFRYGEKWVIRSKWCAGHDLSIIPDLCIPAPTLSEVWRELPQDIYYKTMCCSLMLWKFNKGKFTEVGYWWHDQIIKSFLSENPTDAAIELLIWLKGERHE
jgi:hypothetical protein